MILILGFIVIVGGIFWFNANKDKREIINTSLRVESFNQIKIDSSDSNVKFQESDHYGVIYRGKKEMKPSISVEQDTLKIESPQKDIEINGNIFNWKYQTPMLTIEMPRKELDKLSVDLSNGSVQAGKLKVKTGYIETLNGSINVGKLITKNKFSIETSNGSVKIGKSNAKGFDLDTANGKILYKGHDKSDSYEENKKEDNVLNIDISNGNIAVN